jgi:hypothetical protein
VQSDDRVIDVDTGRPMPVGDGPALALDRTAPAPSRSSPCVPRTSPTACLAGSGAPLRTTRSTPATAVGGTATPCTRIGPYPSLACWSCSVSAPTCQRRKFPTSPRPARSPTGEDQRRPRAGLSGTAGAATACSRSTRTGRPAAASTPATADLPASAAPRTRLPMSRDRSRNPDGLPLQLADVTGHDSSTPQPDRLVCATCAHSRRTGPASGVAPRLDQPPRRHRRRLPSSAGVDLPDRPDGGAWPSTQWRGGGGRKI